jgi:hypothetical protein
MKVKNPYQFPIIVFQYCAIPGAGDEVRIEPGETKTVPPPKPRHGSGLPDNHYDCDLDIPPVKINVAKGEPFHLRFTNYSGAIIRHFEDKFPN